MEEKQRKPIKLQEAFLNRMRKERRWVAVGLLSGERLFGNIAAFDNYCIHLRGYGDEEHLIYKHAITSITPSPEEGG
ncbi:MAG: RNA chaperone Hfq [Deltaproteobacteria bacterium]|nr:MAG: RNA chaperone Hfq [Deltaproteobacteria bacterium]RLB03488.1 MAG: RNA chaperone Hfq [Deltaproteobacteria bacterium]